MHVYHRVLMCSYRASTHVVQGTHKAAHYEHHTTDNGVAKLAQAFSFFSFFFFFFKRSRLHYLADMYATHLIAGVLLLNEA